MALIVPFVDSGAIQIEQIRKRGLDDLVFLIYVFYSYLYLLILNDLLQILTVLNVSFMRDVCISWFVIGQVFRATFQTIKIYFSRNLHLLVRH